MRKTLDSAIFGMNDEASFAKKMRELEAAKAYWQLTITKGIAGEPVVRVDWDSNALQNYYDKLEDLAAV